MKWRKIMVNIEELNYRTVKIRGKTLYFNLEEEYVEWYDKITGSLLISIPAEDQDSNFGELYFKTSSKKFNRILQRILGEKVDLRDKITMEKIQNLMDHFSNDTDYKNYCDWSQPYKVFIE
jgi:hypothetical protein